jgi:hypothetical protein
MNNTEELGKHMSATFEKWKDENKDCFTGPVDGEYLSNRLWLAFMRGGDATEFVLKKRIEELETMVILKLDRPEHSKIVLTNKRGDTFTSRSEELIDFLHDYPSSNGKQD